MAVNQPDRLAQPGQFGYGVAGGQEVGPVLPACFERGLLAGTGRQPPRPLAQVRDDRLMPCLDGGDHLATALRHGLGQHQGGSVPHVLGERLPVGRRLFLGPRSGDRGHVAQVEGGPGRR
jgi:hypothetical protein